MGFIQEWHQPIDIIIELMVSQRLEMQNILQYCPYIKKKKQFKDLQSHPVLADSRIPLRFCLCTM